MAAGGNPADGADGSSDFQKKFVRLAKILSPNFCADTLALVTAQETQSDCEQLVSKGAQGFCVHRAEPAQSPFSGIVTRRFASVISEAATAAV